MYLLAQVPNAVAVANLWPNKQAPRPADLSDIQAKGSGADVIVGASAAGNVTLREAGTFVLVGATQTHPPHPPPPVAAFKPTVKVLFLRHPAQVAAALRQPRYERYDTARDMHHGAFKTFERVFTSVPFDQIILYEEMVLNKPIMAQKLGKLGYSGTEIENMYVEEALLLLPFRLRARLKLTPPPLTRRYAFKRSMNAVAQFNTKVSRWCAKNKGKAYDMGNFKKPPIGQKVFKTAFIDRHATQSDREATALLAPTLSKCVSSRRSAATLPLPFPLTRNPRTLGTTPRTGPSTAGRMPRGSGCGRWRTCLRSARSASTTRARTVSCSSPSTTSGSPSSSTGWPPCTASGCAASCSCRPTRRSTTRSSA